jgi:hypothetical protein
MYEKIRRITSAFSACTWMMKLSSADTSARPLPGPGTSA